MAMWSKGHNITLLVQKGIIYLNKKIDREYGTQDRKEMFYLIDNGISFSFAKTNENGVTTWKFKKDKKLFELLVNYYG